MYVNMTREPGQDSFTILIVEDDIEDRELITEAFASINAHFILKLFANGRKALEYLSTCPKEQLPCLIVLDYNMPEMTGGEVLAGIGKDERLEHIPRIILSTAGQPEFIEECMENGAHAYKIKPSSFSGLVTVAREMLEICKTSTTV
jgi:CheY-like chemotaxis protein